MPSKRDMLALTDAWRPYRSIGTWYLWRLVANQAASRKRAAKARPEAGAGEEGELERREKSGGALP